MGERGDSLFFLEAYLPPPAEHTCVLRVGTDMVPLAGKDDFALGYREG